MLLNWSGVRTERLDYPPAATIFTQGDPATSVMYVETGAVRLSVISHAGKEAVVAVLESGHFFGEGCLAGQSQRMATATAMAPCTVLVVEKPEMVRQLHTRPAFANRFLTHMLTRNIRIEEDLIDQLFNSSEKRLARALLLLARYGDPEAVSQRASEGVSGAPRRDGRHDALARQLLHEQVPEARVHRIQRRPEDQPLPPQRRAPRLTSAGRRSPASRPVNARAVCAFEDIAEPAKLVRWSIDHARRP